MKAWFLHCLLAGGLLASPLLGASQSVPRPELPVDFAESFKVLLPTLDGRDSLGLNTRLRPLAEAMYAFNTQLLAHYRVSDTTQLIRLHYNLGTAALALGRPAEFLTHWRRLRPLPGPRGFAWAAWADARRRVPREQSPAFGLALRAAWRARTDSLPATFRQDLTNSFKGQFAPAMTALALRNAREGLAQMHLAKGGVSYALVEQQLPLNLNYELKRQHRATIEQVLYELNPARITETVVSVPLRDGVRLHALVYRDAARPATQRVPAIVSLSPYPSGQEASRGNVWATNGYVFVYADTRGRRKSEGVFFPYEHDAPDFYDLIDWVSKQPWCDGQVATTGGSYLGFAQWQAIRQGYRHPALKAINPMVAVGFGVDFPRASHMFYPYILQWAQYVSGRDLNAAQFNDYHFWQSVNWKLYKNRLPFARLDSVAGLANPFFQKWVAHPNFDEYWKGILPSTQDYAQLDIPVLTTTGYYDADQAGVLFYYRNHLLNNPNAAQTHQLLIGPYQHGAAQWAPGATQNGLPLEVGAQVAVYRDVLEWFDWRLKGKARPAWVQGAVNYFETGRNRWRAAPTLLAITHDTLRLYLTPQLARADRRRPAGLLTLSPTLPAAQPPLLYRHDMAQVLDSAFLFAQPSLLSDSLYVSSPYNLVFESAPLTKDVMLTGALLPRLFMSLNVPDADFQVSVYEQTAGGRSYSLAESGLRARYRHGGVPRLVKPGEVSRYDFTDNFLFIKRLPAGSRLRFVLEVLNSPFAERNYGFGGVVAQERATGPRIIEARLHTGGKYPSRVDVPIGE
jgi:putative CocE/NonD family hydrolase